jgi:uncharacterized protein
LSGKFGRSSQTFRFSVFIAAGYNVAMERFLDFVVRQLVDFPDEVIIVKDDDPKKTVFRLQLRKSDIGKVVGKHGQTIAAIRNLLDAAAAKHGGRATVEIIEEEEPPPA